jgi:phage terminase small subunit
MGKIQISPEKILQELVAIAFAKVPDCLTVEGNDVRLTEHLTPKQRAAVAAVEKTSTGLKVKFYDKMKALELLGKHFGLFEAKEDPKTQQENNLLEAILQATGQEVDTFDVSELQ